MELFRPDVKGDLMFYDLDTVVINPLPAQPVTTVLSDFYYPDRSIGSGLMFLKQKDRAMVWNEWIKDPEGHMTRHRGDQDFLNKFYWSAARWGKNVISYKAHIRKGLASHNVADVICFHGKPRPWNVEAEWIPSL